MKNLRAIVFFLMTPLFGALASAFADGASQLWYRQPAKTWTEALPVGNGRLGAMVHGGLAEEHLQLNEDTLWNGQPRGYHQEGAVEVLPELRRLLWEGKQDEAEELATKRFMSVPLRQMMYQPLGDLRITLPGHEAGIEYRRELDLATAVARVSYRVGETRYTRETFSSAPDNVLVQHITADRPGAVRALVRLSSPHAGFVVRRVGSELHLSGRVTEGVLPFAARLEVRAPGGTLAWVDGGLEISAAHSLTVVVSAATGYKRFNDITGAPEELAGKALAAVAGKDFAALRDAHVADYRALYDRVALDLGTTPVAAEPTDVRLERKTPAEDPALATLLFNYGRYLLIASSRPGSQPANLQGIWNDLIDPPWGSKYTTNINFEMNYWPAEVANLAECAEPMFSLIEDIMITGADTARAHYGAPGWVLHHNTDLWRGTAPINASNHGIWPTGGAWLCLHLWERYRYSGGRDFLARRVYPAMKGAAAFFMATLVEDPKTGHLISGPSNSPEHGGLVMGPTMDHQIIRGLFIWTAEAARILGTDAGLAERLDALAARIAPNKIGRLGQLQEWLEDKDDPNNRHRHVSHLWGVFPGEDITWKHPDLMNAARTSLELRGDGGTGWALGWKINLWARFRDGDRAHKMVGNLLNPVREDPVTRRSAGGGGVYPNLFDAHPPFQIDGNFAATAGICEMLLQSHARPEGAASQISDLEYEIHLLPALPSAWRTGSVRGLRARGGFELDFAWRDGAITSVTVRSSRGTRTTLRVGDKTVPITLGTGAAGTWDGNLQPVAN